MCQIRNYTVSNPRSCVRVVRRLRAHLLGPDPCLVGDLLQRIRVLLDLGHGGLLALVSARLSCTVDALLHLRGHRLLERVEAFLEQRLQLLL